MPSLHLQHSMFKALVMFFVSCGNSLIKIWMTALSSWFWAVTWVSSAEAWLSSRLAGRYLLLLMALYHLALVWRCRMKFNLISLPVRLASISLDLKLFVRTTHRPLHSYMDRNEHFWNYHFSPTFQKLLVTKLVVTLSTTRYQMKDMNIIFLLTPHSLL